MMYNLRIIQISLALAFSVFSTLGYCISSAIQTTLAAPSAENDSLSIPSPAKPPLSTIIPFHIPSTTLYLHVRFPRTHLRRHSLSQYFIGGILTLANDTIYECIVADGADAFVDWLDPAGTQQQFVELLPNEVVFGFVGLIGGPRFTWGQVRDVVKGLYIYLVEGMRFWETEFQVTEGRRFAGLLGVGKIAESVEYKEAIG